MMKEKEMKRVPKLRFPEFMDDWEQRKLGEIYTERNERGNDNLEILSVSIHNGVSSGELDSNVLGKNVKRSEDKSLYKHVYEGDLVFNMMRAWQGAIGIVKNEGMISPAYISAIPNKNVYPKFMDYCLRRDEVITQINNLSYGVTDFRKRLYWNGFTKVNIMLPSVQEQDKLTELFHNLDKFITLQQRKIKNLKSLKKGMMQKLFNQEVRFKADDGSEFSDWEEKKLDDLVTEYNEKTTQNNQFEVLSSTHDGIKFQKDHFNKKTASADTTGYKIVPRGYFTYRAMSDNDVFVFNRQMIIDKGIVSPAYPVFYVIGVDKIFFEYYINNTDEIRKQLITSKEGGTRYALSFSKFCAMYVRIPSDEIEQQKIADCLSSLDDGIAKQKATLAAWKELKKGLLQQMFV